MFSVEGCPARKPREPGEEYPERGDHLCGYLAGHGVNHACCCRKPVKWRGPAVPAVRRKVLDDVLESALD